MPRPPSDRILDEYIRQLKAPKVSEDIAPNLTRVFDPLSIDKTYEENYDALKKDETLIFNPIQKLLQAEDRAGAALSRDVYRTDSPSELLEKLKAEKNLEFNVTNNVDTGDSGLYKHETREMSLNKNIPLDAQLGTVLHEIGHVEHANKDLADYAKTKQRESVNHDLSDFVNAAASNDLYKLSEVYSRNHFAEPRSYVINKALRNLKLLLRAQGMEPNPDDNPRFDELEFIKEQLRKSEGTDKPRSRFNKTKKALGSSK